MHSQKTGRCQHRQLRGTMANSSRFSCSPKVLLSVMPHRRGCGLPRRFAPRNDSGETSLHPRTRPSFCMSLRTSAHTGVAIRSPRMETWPVGTTLGKSVALPRIRLRCCSLLCAAAGDADCHVAPLLAMTCRRRAGVSIGNYVVPWQIRHAFRVRPKYCFLPCTAAGDADCHVASLLAMTVGKRPCTR